MTPRPLPRFVRIGIRLFLSVFAVACLTWAAVTASSGWQQAGADAMAERLLRGEVFAPAAVGRWLAEDRSPDILKTGTGRLLPARAGHLRSLAILQMSQAEAANMQGDADGDAAFVRLQELTIAALSASPSDGFLWLVLFWAKSTGEGVTSRTIPLLKQSYVLAPHEGWVALRRVRLSLSVMQSLSPDLAERVMAEFGDLVSSGFEIAAAEILEGVAPAMRQALVDRLAGLPDNNRRKLAENLRARKLLDVVVPGIERSEPRPWM